MTRAEKIASIADLKDKFESSSFFYITDSSALTVEEVNNLRRKFFESDIKMHVVKNTLAIKALESASEEKGYGDLIDAFVGPTTLLFSSNASQPAKIIHEFRKTHEKPVLKAAYIDSDVFKGDDQLELLKALKSKEDLIGDVILLLQSPMKNVLGSLQSGQNKLSGLLKALEQRGE